ncbi:MAG: hypothetical protein DCC52_04610 [Chloroflexi bacterium]|nr:MAG: hypothetical protein DCC52_04610 [Chloroflexota bacterium]
MAIRAMVELYLVRHGNAKKLEGESYVTAPLTALGRQQADLTGAYLRAAGIGFDGYYASPLRRATAQARDGLQEMEYREIPATVAVELFARTGWLDGYYEKRAGQALWHPLLGRVSRALVEILRVHSQGRVAVVAHGGVISGVLAWYFPHERERWWHTTVGNCSITRLEIEATRARLGAVDELDHLGALREMAHARNYSFSSRSEGV